MKIRFYFGISFLAAMLVYQSGTPTWSPRVNQTNNWHFNFPIVQPLNALSIPNIGSRHIVYFSMQIIENITLEKSRDDSENDLD